MNGIKDQLFYSLWQRSETAMGQTSQFSLHYFTRRREWDFIILVIFGRASFLFTIFLYLQYNLLLLSFPLYLPLLFFFIKFSCFFIYCFKFTSFHFLHFWFARLLMPNLFSSFPTLYRTVSYLFYQHSLPPLLPSFSHFLIFPPLPS